jgi:hypothetical protein
MIKIFTSALLTLACGGLAVAQSITLDQNSYTGMVVATDTFGRVTQSLNNIDTGANKVWDFSTVIYENTTYYNEQVVATNANFPGATYHAGRRYTLGTNSFQFDTHRWSGITPVGFERIGESIDRQAIPLVGVLPGALATDSLVIKQQEVPYSTSYPLIKFPATYNSSWSATFDFEVEMELTYSTYNHAPFKYKLTTEYAFRCPGWGKAFMVQKNDPTVYGEDKVLLVRIEGKTTDSFYLNGAPASISLLTTMGLQQNKTANSYWDELFRDMEVNALVLYIYGSNAFVNPSSAEIHQLRVPFPDNIKSISADGRMALYPNPVKAGGQLQIKLANATAGQYQYSLSSISGMTTAGGTTTAKGNEPLQLTLPQSLSNGIYWLTLRHNGEVIGTAPFRYGE